MSHLVKLTVSVEENVPVVHPSMLPANMYPSQSKRLGETFIVNLAPAFSGGFAEFSSNPEHSHNFTCYWDAFEATNHLLLGELNNNSIDGLIRSVLNTTPTLGSSFVIRAEIITNEEFFSGNLTPSLHVAETRFVNCAPGRYISGDPSYVQRGVDHNKARDLAIINEFFKLAFSKASFTEPTYLKVTPIPRYSSVGEPMMGGQFQPMMHPVMQNSGLYSSNPNFTNFVDIESNVTNNRSLFVSVRLDGKNGNLTWFDVKNHTSDTVAFEDSKVVCFEQMTGPVTILAARIVAHQLRGGNAEFISIYRAFPRFDFGNTSQFI